MLLLLTVILYYTNSQVSPAQKVFINGDTYIIKFIDSKVFVVYYAITHPFHLCGVQNGENLGKNMNSYKTEDIIVIILLTYCNTVYFEVM